MKPLWVKPIRQLLRDEPDGLTVGEIAERLGVKKSTVSAVLGRMSGVDAYIESWTEGAQRCPPQAIWCVVVPPPNCPKPEPKRKQK